MIFQLCLPTRRHLTGTSSYELNGRLTGPNHSHVLSALELCLTVQKVCWSRVLGAEVIARLSSGRDLLFRTRSGRKYALLSAAYWMHDEDMYLLPRFLMLYVWHPLCVYARNISAGFSYMFEYKPIIWPDASLTLARGVSYDAEHITYACLHLFQSLKAVIVVHLFMFVHFQWKPTCICVLFPSLPREIQLTLIMCSLHFMKKIVTRE